MEEKKDEKPKGTSRDERPNGGQDLGDRDFESLAGWTAVAVVVLFVCVVGTLVFAWCASGGNRPKGGPIAQGHECHEQHDRSTCPHHSWCPAEEGRGVTLVVNVAGGTVSQEAPPVTPPPCPECAKQPTATEVGIGGKDLIVVVDKEKVVEHVVDKEKVVEHVVDKETVVKTEKVKTTEVVGPPSPPPGCKQPIGRVCFKPGLCRARFDRQKVLEIAEGLQGRSGTVLVVGYPDSGSGQRQAKRRAKRVGKALRKVLKDGTETQLAVLTRAASTGGAGTAEAETCDEPHFGTAGVYLIEGLP